MLPDRHRLGDDPIDLLLDRRLDMEETRHQPDREDTPPRVLFLGGQVKGGKPLTLLDFVSWVTQNHTATITEANRCETVAFGLGAHDYLVTVLEEGTRLAGR